MRALGSRDPNPPGCQSRGCRFGHPSPCRGLRNSGGVDPPLPRPGGSVSSPERFHRCRSRWPSAMGRSDFCTLARPTYSHGGATRSRRARRCNGCLCLGAPAPRHAPLDRGISEPRAVLHHRGSRRRACQSLPYIRTSQMTLHPKRFLFATWEGGGTVLPMIAAAKKVAARGHHVRIMSESCNREEIEAAGIRFSSWRRAPNRSDRSADSDFLRDWEVPPGPERIRLVIHRIMTGPSLAYAQDIVDELNQDPADLVISSEFLLGVLAGCESLAQPVAVLTAGICP